MQNKDLLPNLSGHTLSAGFNFVPSLQGCWEDKGWSRSREGQKYLGKGLENRAGERPIQPRGG